MLVIGEPMTVTGDIVLLGDVPQGATFHFAANADASVLYVKTDIGPMNVATCAHWDGTQGDWPCILTPRQVNPVGWVAPS